MPSRSSMFDPFQQIRRELDDVFQSYLGEGFAPETAKSVQKSLISPAVDIFLEGEMLRIDVDLPGVDPSDVDCSLKEGVLTIKGERQQMRAGNGEQIRERRFGTFERRITLPDGIDEESIQAHFDKGVLTVTARMRPAAGQPRRIEISGTGRNEATGGSRASQKPQPGPAGQASAQPHQGAVQGEISPTDGQPDPGHQKR